LGIPSFESKFLLKGYQMETSKTSPEIALANKIDEVVEKFRETNVSIDSAKAIAIRLERVYYAYNRAVREKRCTQDLELVLPCKEDLENTFDLISHLLAIVHYENERACESLESVRFDYAKATN
jgi:hypothetical protein